MPPTVVPLAMTSSQGDQQVFSLRTLRRVAEHGSFLTYDFSDDADSVITGLEFSCPDSFTNQSVPTLSSDQCDMLENYLDLCDTIHAQSSISHKVHNTSDDLQSNIDHAMFLLTRAPRLPQSCGLFYQNSRTPWGILSVLALIWTQQRSM